MGHANGDQHKAWLKVLLVEVEENRSANAAAWMSVALAAHDKKASKKWLAVAESRRPEPPKQRVGILGALRRGPVSPSQTYNAMALAYFLNNQTARALELLSMLTAHGNPRPDWLANASIEAGHGFDAFLKPLKPSERARVISGLLDLRLRAGDCKAPKRLIELQSRWAGHTMGLVERFNEQCKPERGALVTLKSVATRLGNSTDGLGALALLFAKHGKRLKALTMIARIKRNVIRGRALLRLALQDPSPLTAAEDTVLRGMAAIGR